MRFGYICKLIVAITTALLATLPAGGKAESNEHCIKVKISEISFVDDGSYAVLYADCNESECSGFAIVLCSDGEFADTDNLCPDACMTAACSDDKCALVWDFEKCTGYKGFIAKIKLTGNVRIIKAAAWSDSEGLAVNFESSTEKIYKASELCTGLIYVTQYKKYRPEENIDAVFCEGCFMSSYDGEYVTVGLRTPVIGTAPEIPLSKYTELR